MNANWINSATLWSAAAAALQLSLSQEGKFAPNPKLKLNEFDLTIDYITNDVNRFIGIYLFDFSGFVLKVDESFCF